MSEVLAGAVDDFDDETRRLVWVDGVEVGVLLHDGRFYAFENRCAHQGGPVCEGVVVGRVESVLTSGKVETARRFSETELHLVCPWHGWEYELASGRCAADARFGIRPYRVEVRDGSVFVSPAAQMEGTASNGAPGA